MVLNGVIQYYILGPTYSIIATHPEFATPPLKTSTQTDIKVK